MAKKKKKEKLLFQSPKGMRDIMPNDQFYWDKVRGAINKVAEIYGFSRIDTPIVESAELFERSGKATDIVEKQMFFLKAKGGDRLVLRPEGTAPIVRAYFEHGLAKAPQPIKLFYFGPMFRYEQPQAGRFRQHYQAGFEILGGDANPVYDAEAILASYGLMEELKIKNLVVKINSLGCRQCRPLYVKKLQEYYRKRKNLICKDCRYRLAIRPLRLLDCKKEKCVELKSGAPLIVDKLCRDCREHLKEVLEYLDGVSLPYSLDPYLVRGLDYYNKTVFEFFLATEEENKPNIALGGGGRYDYLSEMIGVKRLAATGSSIGAERLIEAMKFYKPTVAKKEAEVFLIHIGKEAKKKGFVILEQLRRAGIRAMEIFGKESLRSQLRVADSKKSRLALIFGQKEVFEESIIIRDMEGGAQETVPLKKLTEEVKKRLR